MSLKTYIRVENWTKIEFQSYFVQVRNGQTSRAPRPERIILLFFIVFYIFTTACHGDVQPALAEIEKVGPEILEPHDVIRVTGNGFIEGPVKMWLSGDFQPESLGSTQKRKIALEGIATSETGIEVPIPVRVMKRIVRQSSRFNGRLEVDFTAPHSAVRVFAAIDNVNLVFRPGAGGIAFTAEQIRRATRTLREMGIVLITSPDNEELVVSDVMHGSAAANVGLTYGDRLLAVDGKAISGPADLAHLTRQKEHVFSVVSRIGTMREVSIPPVHGPYVDQDEFTAIILSSIAFGLFLALVAPTRRRSHIRVFRGDPVMRGIGFALVSFLITLIPAAAVMLPNQYLLLGVLLGTNAFGLTMRYLIDRTKRSWFFSVAHALIMPIVFILSGYLGSGIGLKEIVSSQSVSSYGPHAWSNPFTLAALFAAITILWPQGIRQSRQKSLVSITQWIAGVPVAAAVSACLLGGWLVPFASSSGAAPEGGWPLAIGCLIFLAKTWLVLVAARFFAHLTRGDRRRRGTKNALWLPLMLLIVLSASAIAYDAYQLPPVAQAVGQLLATALFFTFASTLIALRIKAALSSHELKKDNQYNPSLETPPVRSS